VPLSDTETRVLQTTDVIREEVENAQANSGQLNLLAKVG
jgi:hypothetical protein